MCVCAWGVRGTWTPVISLSVKYRFISPRFFLKSSGSQKFLNTQHDGFGQLVTSLASVDMKLFTSFILLMGIGHSFYCKHINAPNQECYPRLPRGKTYSPLTKRTCKFPPGMYTRDGRISWARSVHQHVWAAEPGFPHRHSGLGLLSDDELRGSMPRLQGSERSSIDQLTLGSPHQGFDFPTLHRLQVELDPRHQNRNSVCEYTPYPSHIVCLENNWFLVLTRTKWRNQ